MATVSRNSYPVPLPLRPGGSMAVEQPAHARPLALLTANGLSADSIADGPNHPHRFIYASTASAGLETLLGMWPTVKASLPNASLHVYYGFWPYGMWNEQPHLRKMKERLEPLLKLPGVAYFGMRPEKEAEV